jgi:hypothetical protein
MLSRKDRLAVLAASITAGNQGRVLFDISATARVLGISRGVVASELDKCGILATRVRDGRRYTALDLATFCDARRVTPFQPLE